MKSSIRHYSFLTISLILLSFGSALAQRNEPFKVKWGKTFEDAKKSFLQDLIAYDKTGFYVTTGKAKAIGEPTDGTYQIQYFDHELSLRRSQKIELKTNGKYEMLEAFVQLNEDIYLFTSQVDLKIKKQAMYVRKVDKATLLAEPSGRKVAEMPVGKSLVYSRAVGSYSVRLSRDSSHVMVFYALPFEKGEPERFGVHVMDNQLKELWHRDITLPYRDELFTFGSMKVSNDGQVYVLGKYYKDKAKAIRNGKPNYEYRIFAYASESAKVKEYPMVSGKHFLTDMQIGILDNGDIACAGFYSDEGLTSIRGTFFLRVESATGEITTSNFKEFDTDFLTQNMNERQAEKLKKKEEKGGDVEMDQYDLHDLVMRSDGGVVLVGEQYYVRTHTYTTYTNGVPTYHSYTSYHYGDIIAVNVSPAGVIEWSAILPKRQSTQGQGIFYFSYSLAVVGDALYVLYNDDPKNIDFKMPGTPRVLSGTESSIIMVNQIDGSGKVTRYPIFSSFGADLSFWPNVSEQVSPHDLILFAKRKRDQQFVRVTFSE